ncbi:hypothetical protein [Enterococcus raffinosus]
MELSKERIAHDIAVSSLAIQYDLNKTIALNKAENERKHNPEADISVDISFDALEAYTETYNAVIEELN